MFRRQRITGREGRKRDEEDRKARDKTVQQHCFFPRNILVVLKPASRGSAGKLPLWRFSYWSRKLYSLNEPEGLQYWRDTIAMILSKAMQQIENQELMESPQVEKNPNKLIETRASTNNNLRNWLILISLRNKIKYIICNIIMTYTVYKCITLIK